MKSPAQADANDRLAAILVAHDLHAATLRPDHRDQLKRALQAYWQAIQTLNPQPSERTRHAR